MEKLNRLSRKKQRMIFIGISLVCLSLAAFLVLSAFKDNIVFFLTPTEVKEKNIPIGKKIRVGGLVQNGSLKGDGDTHFFTVTDNKSEIQVYYKGLLPDLFKEGQGVVILGSINNEKVFIAKEILAKHDEKYMPPEVAEALKKSGYMKKEK